MDVKIDITYSIEDALRELGEDSKIQADSEIIVFKAEDKFFVGGGCEATRIIVKDSANTIIDRQRNVSVCMRNTSD